MEEDIGYDFKKALPNKLVQEDGTITDIVGREVVDATEAYDSKPALPNKFLNPDGTYTTLNAIIAEMVDTSIYRLVDELPEEGDLEKIYLVPNGSGNFIEYRWTGTKWDPIGMVEFNLADYPTNQDMNSAISSAAATTLSNAKSYADNKASDAEANAKNYADGLASNYDAAGSAGVAESNAKAYADNNFLRKDNVTPYTPVDNYDPATKKYVDDSISSSITQVLEGSY